MFWLAAHMWGLLVAAFALGAVIAWWIWGRLSGDLDLARRDASELRDGNETLRAQVDRLEPDAAAKPRLEGEIQTLRSQLSDKDAALASVADETLDLKRQLEIVPGLRREAEQLPGLRRQVEELPELRRQAEALPAVRQELEGRIKTLEQSLLNAKSEKDAA